MTALSNIALSPARPIRPLTDDEIDHVVGAYGSESEAATAAYYMWLDWSNAHGSGVSDYQGFRGNEIPSGYDVDYGPSGVFWAVVWTFEETEFPGTILHVGYIKDTYN